ncbi:3-dehydroquinate synthase [Thalassoglobus neptunius]|uniref:3-dehydroquinate synthase n=1 Tax=Thalassoglobus neptunius TaxID=1938619 RepID=A0A5C5WI98_9PLAN|nr:3-dehydroquinate synthase [Thalassoglobus neptunius]TWT49815.1 3-dehydroquinate synthase [Thalassoglobus neptunius]
MNQENSSLPDGADSQNQSLDIQFHVPCVHRLRFTRDLFGRDQDVLSDLLELSGDRVPRVQFWVDELLAKAQPNLSSKIRRFANARSNELNMVGNIQTCPGGEEVKNDIHIIERMLKCMNAADLDRRSYVVVIGGGAVLDAVGFAAAIAHRGIRLIRIPTTTLAQADSGVGVKNSVNLFAKKNWIGTFNVPWAVINDEAMLETLPDREFRNGFSEAVKVSLLKDADEFARIERDAHRIRERDMDAARPVIRRSAQLHIEHITAGGDPFEALEARPLDYGHWSAHKLEPMTNFEVRHGEAVAIGVAVDTVYSSLAHGLPKADAVRVLHCLRNLGLHLNHPMLHETETLLDGLEEFRQHLGGRLTLTMLPAIGKKIDVHEVDKKQMLQAIETVVDFMSEQSDSMTLDLRNE